MPPERMTRWTFAMTIGTVTMGVAVLGGLWALHQDSKAYAAQVANHGARISNIERSMARIDEMADDVSAIREALADERGWRRGLLQSLPGVESE